MAKTVGARELKARLGSYLHEVEQLEEKLRRLAAEGFITKGTGRPLRPFKPIKITGPPISDTIIEDREDRC